MHPATGSRVAIDHPTLASAELAEVRGGSSCLGGGLVAAGFGGVIGGGYQSLATDHKMVGGTMVFKKPQYGKGLIMGALMGVPLGCAIGKAGDAVSHAFSH